MWRIFCIIIFCLLAGELIPFSFFKIISDIVGFKSTILFCALFRSHMSHIYFYLYILFTLFLAIFWIDIPIYYTFIPFVSLKNNVCFQFCDCSRNYNIHTYQNLKFVKTFIFLPYVIKKLDHLNSIRTPPDLNIIAV